MIYLKERLPASDPFRTNRKQIINLNYTKEIDPYYSNSLLVTLLGGSTIEMSQ